MEEYRFEHGPVWVEGGSEDLVYRRQEVLAGLRGRTILGVWVFHGLDRGNIVEMDTEVFDRGNDVSLVLRSEHKETVGNFDAWAFYPMEYTVSEKGIGVNLVCRVNGDWYHIKTESDTYFKPETMDWKGLKARPHWGIRFRLQ